MVTQRWPRPGDAGWEGLGLSQTWAQLPGAYRCNTEHREPKGCRICPKASDELHPLTARPQLNRQSQAPSTEDSHGRETREGGLPAAPPGPPGLGQLGQLPWKQRNSHGAGPLTEALPAQAHCLCLIRYQNFCSISLNCSRLSTIIKMKTQSGRTFQDRDLWSRE